MTLIDTDRSLEIEAATRYNGRERRKNFLSPRLRKFLFLGLGAATLATEADLLASQQHPVQAQAIKLSETGMIGVPIIPKEAHESFQGAPGYVTSEVYPVGTPQSDLDAITNNFNAFMEGTTFYSDSGLTQPIPSDKILSYVSSVFCDVVDLKGNIVGKLFVGMDAQPLFSSNPDDPNNPEDVVSVQKGAMIVDGGNGNYDLVPPSDPANGIETVSILLNNTNSSAWKTITNQDLPAKITQVAFLSHDTKNNTISLLEQSGLGQSYDANSDAAQTLLGNTVTLKEASASTTNLVDSRVGIPFRIEMPVGEKGTFTPLISQSDAAEVGMYLYKYNAGSTTWDSGVSPIEYQIRDKSNIIAYNLAWQRNVLKQEGGYIDGVFYKPNSTQIISLIGESDETFIANLEKGQKQGNTYGFPVPTENFDGSSPEKAVIENYPLPIVSGTIADKNLAIKDGLSIVILISNNQEDVVSQWQGPNDPYNIGLTNGNFKTGIYNNGDGKTLIIHYSPPVGDSSKAYDWWESVPMLLSLPQAEQVATIEVGTYNGKRITNFGKDTDFITKTNPEIVAIFKKYITNSDKPLGITVKDASGQMHTY